MKRWEIINNLIKKHSYKSYLEVGYQYGVNFNKIRCDKKYSIDPNGKAMFKGTSDEFFKQNRSTFDAIFIDGLHLAEQVRSDIINSMKVLNEGGCMVLHDCYPKTKRMAQRKDNGEEWTGDVWRAWVGFLSRHDGFTYNTDYGVGIAYKQPLMNFSIVDEEMFSQLPSLLNLKKPS